MKRDTIYSIQFLRGVAAFLVVTEHLLLEEGISNYGAIGVDLFFVISGFIIYFVTQNSQDWFLLKRVIRIVPIYWIGTICILIVSIFLPNALNGARFDLGHFFASLFFVPYWSELTGIRPLLSLGWTLNYEMAFYILFFLGMKISINWRFEITSTFLLVLYVLSNTLSPSEETSTYFFTSSVYLEFILGMAVGRIYFLVDEFRLPKFNTPFLVFSIMVFLAISTIKPTGSRLIDYGLPSVMLFVAVLCAEKRFSSSEAMQNVSSFCGDISYSLYIFHIYAIAIYGRIFDLSGFALFFMSYATIPVAAYFVFSYLERPISRYLTKRTILKSPPFLGRWYKGFSVRK